MVKSNNRPSVAEKMTVWSAQRYVDAHPEMSIVQARINPLGNLGTEHFFRVEYGKNVAILVADSEEGWSLANELKLDGYTALSLVKLALTKVRVDLMLCEIGLEASPRKSNGHCFVFCVIWEREKFLMRVNQQGLVSKGSE